MITIPKDHHRAVERLLSLKPDALANLAAAIAQSPPAASFRSFATRLDEQLKPPIPGITGMIQVLATLGIISQEDETPEDTADQLISAAEKDHLYNPKSDAERDQTKGQLAQVLKASQPLILTGKARQLLSEHQHVYCEGNSRIISDIRPIFPPGELASPVGSVIVHTLKLAYHEATEAKEFYVALDTEDVRLLRDLLDRAIAKEAKLIATLSQSKFPYIGINTEDE